MFPMVIMAMLADDRRARQRFQRLAPARGATRTQRNGNGRLSLQQRIAPVAQRTGEESVLVRTGDEQARVRSAGEISHGRRWSRRLSSSQFTA